MGNTVAVDFQVNLSKWCTYSMYSVHTRCLRVRDMPPARTDSSTGLDVLFLWWRKGVSSISPEL